jgi:hypothetical protein
MTSSVSLLVLASFAFVVAFVIGSALTAPAPSSSSLSSNSNKDLSSFIASQLHHQHRQIGERNRAQRAVPFRWGKRAGKSSRQVPFRWGKRATRQIPFRWGKRNSRQVPFRWGKRAQLESEERGEQEADSSLMSSSSSIDDEANNFVKMECKNIATLVSAMSPQHIKKFANEWQELLELLDLCTLFNESFESNHPESATATYVDPMSNLFYESEEETQEDGNPSSEIVDVENDELQSLESELEAEVRNGEIGENSRTRPLQSPNKRGKNIPFRWGK